MLMFRFLGHPMEQFTWLRVRSIPLIYALQIILMFIIKYQVPKSKQSFV